jgi:hypothetical protein
VRHLLRQRTAPAAVLAAVTLAISGTVVLAGPATAEPAPAAAPSHSAAASSPRPVFLINGDQLLARRVPGGGLAVSLLRTTASGGGLIGLKLDSLTAEIPGDAVPYLGRGLDPSLFEAAALQRAEAGGRLPVRVSFDGHRPELPGLTITSSGAGSEHGYLTASSARLFGAALARQFRADHARASYGTDGMFGAGVNISLAGAASAAKKAARPDFPMHTVTVTGSNLSGKPDNGDTIWVFNAGNVDKFGDPIESNNFFFHGTAKFSVPAGYYWAIGDFFSVTKNGGFAERLAFLPQFKVTGNTTVHVAERAASSEITMATPRPGVIQSTSFQVIRGGLDGTSNSFSWTDSGLSLWVSPTTRKPTVGTLRSWASEQLTSRPKAKGIPYAYYLDYAGPDGTIPAQQHYVVRPASLATIDERYYQDVRTEGAWIDFGGFAQQIEGVAFGEYFPLRLPGQQIQYFSAGPKLFWNTQYAEFNPENYFPWGGQSDDTFRALPAGQQTVEWNRYPLHPQPYVSTGGLGGRLFPLMPSAVRVGRKLYLNTTPFSDNQPEHVGAGFEAGPGATVTGRYLIDQDGVKIASGNAVNGIPAVRLSPKPSVIRFALTATMIGRLFPLSTSSRTVWTWRSGSQPQVRLPAYWLCGYVIVRHEYKLVNKCAVQPMMTLNYQVQGLAQNGTVAPGKQVIDLRVGHIQEARTSAITRATAQVSYDDGQRWLQASVTRAGGSSFRITFTAPAGVDPTLRVIATDAAGGSIRETILRAYGVRL